MLKQLNLFETDNEHLFMEVVDGHYLTSRETMQRLFSLFLLGVAGCEVVMTVLLLVA